MKPFVIHQTDLFHTYNDPDDHFDLACQFALDYLGQIDLGGVLIDYPPPQFGDPAIQSVNQMNYMTGKSVPVAVGTPDAFDANHIRAGANAGNAGVNMLLNALRDARRPAHIHIVGSCRDVAIAARLAPGLFRDNCAAIFLNAGSSAPDGVPEYNVAVDPASYRAIFDVACPVYWMPCFERAPSATQPFALGEYGTYYHFDQSEILPHLAEDVQNMFLYALGKSSDANWLSYLRTPVDAALLERLCGERRCMYCTGGFLRSAGKTVTKRGDIVDLADCRAGDAVFDFVPVTAVCDANGFVSWRTTDSATNRFIYRVNDLSVYCSAMTAAMKTLLCELP